jgi:putative methionine-R-sulfoxide reductase with GAF domain
VNEVNSFGDDGSTVGLNLTGLTQPPLEVHPTTDAAKLADALASHVTQEESRLNEELVQACVATGATGAAIALVRGDEIVCHASAGPHAPSVGARLDPHSGLSGACIRTREVQHCSDTQTDNRVDAEACRRLGVRSVVVLPLMDREQLFGVLEVLSSQPDAFDKKDLDALQTLARRIVENRGQNWEAAAILPTEESGSVPRETVQVVRLDNGSSLKSATGLPTRRSTTRRSAILATLLNILVIAAALLLGTLVGWRLGWEKATASFKSGPRGHSADASSTNVRTTRTEPQTTVIQPALSMSEDCGPSSAYPVQPPQDAGLTICQGDRVIFRSPNPSSPDKDLKASSRSAALRTGQLRQ